LAESQDVQLLEAKEQVKQVWSQAKQTKGLFSDVS